MAVLLIKKDNFKQGLPAGFGWDQASRKIVSNQSYSLVTDDKEFDGQSRTFEVNNVSDIEAVRDQLFTKPLVTVSKCNKQYKVYRGRRDDEGNREVDYLTMTDDFIVILNTAHPEVKNTLDEWFEKAKKLLNDNAKFVVVFDLDQSVKMWYAQVPHENSDPGSAQAIGSSFYIAHNAEPQSNCASCLFGCEQPIQKAIWLVCFPCCLVTGVPYFVCRKCVQNIKDVKISTRFHTQEHNAVSPPGTNLMSLFQSAAPQMVTTVVTTQLPGDQYPLQQYGQSPRAQPYPQYGQPSAQPYPQHGQPPAQSYPQHGQLPAQSYPQYSQPPTQPYPQYGQPTSQGYPQQYQVQPTTHPTQY